MVVSCIKGRSIKSPHSLTYAVIQFHPITILRIGLWYVPPKKIGSVINAYSFHLLSLSLCVCVRVCNKNIAQSIPVKILDEQGFFPEDTRDLGDALTPIDSHYAVGRNIRNHGKIGTTTTTIHEKLPPGMFIQTKMLFHREIMSIRRDITALGARFGLTIFLGTLVGVIFLNVGSSDSSIQSNLQSHYGGLIVVAMMSMFGTAQPALLAFPAERPVFLREYSTNHYSVVSYFISRLTMEAVITGAQTLVQVRTFLRLCQC